MAFETFVEWVTPWKYLIHLESMHCSKEHPPQQAEDILAPHGIKVIEEEYKIPVSRCISDGKGSATLEQEKEHGGDFFHSESSCV